MISNSERILIVEDDPRICRLLERYLTRESYEVFVCHSGVQFRDELELRKPNCVLVDLKLPDVNGLDLVREVRSEYPQLGIVVITGSGETIDRIIGLELGADDYIPKPFEEREVLARIRSVLRRQQLNPLEQKSATLSFNDFTIDFDRHVLLKADVPVDLTSREFALLVVLIEAKNKVLSRDKIMDLLVGRDWFPSDRSVDVLIGRIRKKLGTNPDDPEIIKTVRGAGYLFALKLNRQE